MKTLFKKPVPRPRRESLIEVIPDGVAGQCSVHCPAFFTAAYKRYTRVYLHAGEFPDDGCAACKAGRCVKRLEHIDSQIIQLVHDVQREMN